MDMDIVWKDGDTWMVFNLADILNKSRNHCIHLFNLGIPVIVRQGDQYIVNREKIADNYRAKEKKAMMFSDCTPSDEPLLKVGFINK